MPAWALPLRVESNNDDFTVTRQMTNDDSQDFERSQKIKVILRECIDKDSLTLVSCFKNTRQKEESEINRR